MKKIILIAVLLKTFCYAESFTMNETLKNGIEYYFSIIIPLFYQGQKDFDQQSNIMYRSYHIVMQGEHPLHFMKESSNLLFDFNFRINYEKQSVQGIMLTSEEIEDSLYEYWIFAMSDHGTPYNYACFYVTKADSIKSKREIINISKKYAETYTLKSGKVFDLTIKNIAALYQLAPWLKLESFSQTKYENIIVKWKKDVPYVRKMNFFERLYFKNLKKSKR